MKKRASQRRELQFVIVLDMAYVEGPLDGKTIHDVERKFSSRAQAVKAYDDLKQASDTVSPRVHKQYAFVPERLRTYKKEVIK